MTNKFIAIVILAAFFILGSQYMILISGSADQGANVSSAYQDQYNTTRDTSIVTISFMKFLAPIIGAIGIVVAVKLLGKGFK